MSYAAWSGITYNESDWWDQVRRLQELWEFIEDSKIFYDPRTHRAVVTVPTFLINFLLLRVQESLAAILECCEIHKKIWVFLETFLIVNMLDDILMNYTMIQTIWRHYRRFWEQKELRKLRAKNHCNQYLYLAFRWEQDKCPDGAKCLVSVTDHAVGIGTCTQGMTIPS